MVENYGSPHMAENLLDTTVIELINDLVNRGIDSSAVELSLNNEGGKVGRAAVITVVGPHVGDVINAVNGVIFEKKAEEN